LRRQLDEIIQQGSVMKKPPQNNRNRRLRILPVSVQTRLSGNGFSSSLNGYPTQGHRSKPVYCRGQRQNVFLGGFSIDRQKRFWDKFLEQGLVESVQKGKAERCWIDFVGTASISK